MLQKKGAGNKEPEKMRVVGLKPIPVNEIDRNPETLILLGIQVY